MPPCWTPSSSSRSRSGSISLARRASGFRPPESSPLSRARAAGSQPEERLVEAAGPESPEVEGDVDEAQLAQAVGDRVGPTVLPEARDLLLRDLEPSDLAVVPHAEVPEAERPDRRLRPVDLTELLGGDRRPVREPRGQTRHRRLVPRREVEGPGQLADLR